MSSITTQQTKLDLELVPKENRLDIGKCNGRIPCGLTPREPTFQVVLDAIALTPCYPTFLITADVPEVYMHQFWNSVYKHDTFYRFKIDKKKRFKLTLEVFRDIFQICPRVPGRDFDPLPSKEDTVSFLRELGHTGEINSLNDVVVDQMHQPWRTFAALINRGLSGKTSGLDKLRLSRAQILWGMFYQKNVDYVELLWEDFIYQIENRVYKKQENIFISAKESTQIYGAILPECLTSPTMKESKAYKTYLGYATSVVPPKIARKFNNASPSKKDGDLVPIDEEHQEEEFEDDDQEKEEFVHTPSPTDDKDDDNLESESDDVNKSNEESDDVNKRDEESDDVIKGDKEIVQETTQEQVVKDAHVIISTVTKKTEVHITSSSCSSDLASKFLIFLDIPHTDAEIVSPLDVHVCDTPITALEKEVAKLKKDPLHTQVTTLVDEHLDTRLGETREEFMNFLSESLTARIKEQVKDQLPQILPKEVSNFAPPVIEALIKESRDEVTLAKVSSQPHSTYEAASTLTKFELKKILIDKMEKSESYLAAPEHRDCYDSLKKSYDLDKDFFFSYDVYSLKRSRKDKDKDEDPSAGSDRGLKKRKLSKDAEPTTGPKKKDSMSGSSKGTKSQLKSSRKSVQSEEPVFEVADLDMPQDQERNLDDNEDETRNKTASRQCYKALSENLDWENPKGSDYPFDLSKPLPLITRGKHQRVPFEYFLNNDIKYLQRGVSTMTYTTSTTKTKVAQYDLLGIEDKVPNIRSPVKVAYDKYALWGYLTLERTTHYQEYRHIVLAEEKMEYIGKENSSFHDQGHQQAVKGKEDDEEFGEICWRFNTLVGNPVKGILLTMNLPDHSRSRANIEGICKDGDERRSLKLQESQEICIHYKLFQINQIEKGIAVSLRNHKVIKMQSLPRWRNDRITWVMITKFQDHILQSRQDKETSSHLKSMITTSITQVNI
ncbi:hypothetical protein Tco_1110926 [Tanacetum coccineum]|uniref:Uncharacterized protein n=1 Tax=Tanacetum coccineum TaxID=301880 RepID=A0ABQ5IM99_9ASTR